MKNLLLVKEIDKANHFIVGYIVYYFSYIFIGNWMALIPLLLIAFGKELIDSYKRKTPFDWEDLAYTLAGGIPIFTVTI
jgi:hypothetical protein